MVFGLPHRSFVTVFSPPATFPRIYVSFIGTYSLKTFAIHRSQNIKGNMGLAWRMFRVLWTFWRPCSEDQTNRRLQVERKRREKEDGVRNKRTGTMQRLLEGSRRLSNNCLDLFNASYHHKVMACHKQQRSIADPMLIFKCEYKYWNRNSILLRICSIDHIPLPEWGNSLTFFCINYPSAGSSALALSTF